MNLKHLFTAMPTSATVVDGSPKNDADSFETAATATATMSTVSSSCSSSTSTALSDDNNNNKNGHCEITTSESTTSSVSEYASNRGIKGTDDGHKVVEGVKLPSHRMFSHYPHRRHGHQDTTNSSSSSSDNNSISNIKKENERNFTPIPLYRNGHGVRSITFFGMDIKIYVASMYTSTSFQSAQQVLCPSWRLNLVRTEYHHSHQQDGERQQTHDWTHDDSPSSSSLGYNRSHLSYPEVVQLDFTFLRYVNRNRVINAWMQQLDHSVTHKNYDGYETDRTNFVAAASQRPIESGGTQSVIIVGNETRIIDQGHHTSTIIGHDFQQSFLSMWFGDNAVALDLKTGLLQGHDHDRRRDHDDHQYQYDQKSYG